MATSASVDVTIRIVVRRPPQNCRFTLQRGKREPREEIDAATSSASELTFAVPVTAKPVRNNQADFGGPFVQGAPTERFIYVASPGRRAKVRLDDIPWTVIRAAAEVSRPIIGVFEGKAKDGGAFCASVRPIESWRVG
jgi:hypothetical protein